MLVINEKIGYNSTMSLIVSALIIFVKNFGGI